MPRPNFFIVGAPKCGTTSLASWLSQHPDVFIPPAKELNFFDDDHQRPDRLTLKQYENLFASTDARAVGEASVWYLYSRNAVPNILRYQPEARFIVCLRNPVEMAFSLHHQQVFSGNEDVRDFRSAWEAQEARKAGAPVKAYERSQLYYGDVCKLGEQVERLLSHTRKVHFVRLEEIKANPEATFSAVLNFLDLARFEPELAPRNPAHERRYLSLQKLVQLFFRTKRRLRIRKGFGALTALNHWNSRLGKWKFDPELAAELTDYFHEDCVRLEELVSDAGRA